MRRWRRGEAVASSSRGPGPRAQAIDCMVDSPLFDEEWYGNTYGVAGSRVDLVGDYVSGGTTTGRKPNPLFDGRWYLRTYPDAAESGVFPLQHYLDVGAAQLRKPSLLFDPRWYLSSSAAGGVRAEDALRHFLEVGWRESVDPIPQFAGRWYASRYPEVAASGLSPIAHFVRVGGTALYDPNPLFSSTWYADRHPGARTGNEPPLAHYLAFGWRKDLSPHPEFDARWYRERYGIDVDEDTLAHYLSRGRPAGYVTRADSESCVYAPVAVPTAAEGRWLVPVLRLHVDAEVRVVDSKPWRGGVVVERVSSALTTVPRTRESDIVRSPSGPVELTLRGSWLVDIDWLRPVRGSRASWAFDDPEIMEWLDRLADNVPERARSSWEAAGLVAGGGDWLRMGAAGTASDAMVDRRTRPAVLRGETVVQRVMVVTAAASDRSVGLRNSLPSLLSACEWSIADVDVDSDVPEVDDVLDAHIRAAPPDVAIVVAPAATMACRTLVARDVPFVMYVDDEVGWKGWCSDVTDARDRSMAEAMRAADEVVFASGAAREAWSGLSRPGWRGSHACEAEEFNAVSTRGVASIARRPRAVILPRGWL